jgi:biopolymer transport protein ExbB
MSILNMILAQVTPADATVQQAADTLQQAADSAAQLVNDSIAALAAATAPVAAAAEPIVKELSAWELIKAGGWWIMIPLALLAIVSIYIFFERLFAINQANRQDSSFMDRIKEYIHRGEVDQALKLCQDTNTPYSRMIEKGVSRIGRPMNDVLVAIENVGNMEVAKLEKGFNWLATTAAGAPMIGFLGTVIGMVQAFFQLASAGNNSNVTILASGIYQALVTTVAGLIVGIIALFAYNFLTSRVNKVMSKLEGKTMEFMDLLNEPAK